MSPVPTVKVFRIYLTITITLHNVVGFYFLCRLGGFVCFDAITYVLSLFLFGVLFSSTPRNIYEAAAQQMCKFSISYIFTPVGGYIADWLEGKKKDPERSMIMLMSDDINAMHDQN